MAHLSTVLNLTNTEFVLCLVALFFLWRNGLLKQYSYLAALLAVQVLSAAIYLPVIYFAHHGLGAVRAYHIYFYTYWTSFAIEAVLWLMVIYSMYKLAMAPLKGLQTLGMLVFRWAAAISAVVTIAMAFGPHTSTATMIATAVTQLTQTASILTLCLLLFVTFAIRPMGLTFRSRIFGVSLGMGILATNNLICSAWFSSNPHMGGTLDMFNAVTSLTTMLLWTTYFALPEPKRQFNYYVIPPDGEVKVFYIGPHAPSLSPDDVQLVHRLWLNMRRDPAVQDLHHSDIITYALTRLAGQYAREKVEIVRDLRNVRAAAALPDAPRLGNPNPSEDSAVQPPQRAIRQTRDQ